jgi:UDP-glucose 4-epimerase
MAKVTVTGGAGFIGSNLVDRLLQDGHQVSIVDNFLTGRAQNIAHTLGRITLHRTDIRDLPALRTAFAGADYVLHLAALPSVPRSVKDPHTTHEIGATGTLNVLTAARDAGVKRVVYSSSSSIYGDNPAPHKHEALTPNPLSPYGASKILGEYYCRQFWQLYGLETVSLRYFNVFGPRQDPNSEYSAVIPKFAALMLQGRQPTIFGDGTQSRDFTYVENVVQANIAAMTAPCAAGESINVANGDRITLNQLVSTLNRVLGTSIAPIHGKPRPGDILHSCADNAKARRLLGYAPAVDFEEGIRRTVGSLHQP